MAAKSSIVLKSFYDAGVKKIEKAIDKMLATSLLLPKGTHAPKKPIKGKKINPDCRFSDNGDNYVRVFVKGVGNIPLGQSIALASRYRAAGWACTVENRDGGVLVKLN
jgi:hypothetical protein